jgi:hypothetical protein
VDCRTGLNDMEKVKFLTLPGLETRHLGRTARKPVGVPTELPRPNLTFINLHFNIFE